MGNEIIDLTAQIVSAHVAANDVALDQLSPLIRNVHQALTTVGPLVEPSKPESAVDTKKSVFADHILCLDCGGSFKMLKGHIRKNHQMTPHEYRSKWGLPPSYPMVAAEYAASQSQWAMDIGLGRKAVAPLPKKRGRPAKARS